MNIKKTGMRGVVLALLLAVVGSARAAEPSIAVVNMEQVFKEHQRLKAVIAELNEQSAKEAEERKKAVAELEKLQTELRQLQAEAENPMITEARREERKAKAEAKLRELRDRKASCRERV